MKLVIQFRRDNEYGNAYEGTCTIHDVDIVFDDLKPMIARGQHRQVIGAIHEAMDPNFVKGWGKAQYDPDPSHIMTPDGPAECNHHPAHYGVTQSVCLYCKEPIVKSTDGWVVDTCKFCDKVVKRGTGCVNPHCIVQKSKVHANVPYIEPDPIDLKGFPILDGEEVKYVPMDLYESPDIQATKTAIMTYMYTKVANKESLAVMLAQDLGYEYTEDDGWQLEYVAPEPNDALKAAAERYKAKPVQRAKPMPRKLKMTTTKEKPREFWMYRYVGEHNNQEIIGPWKYCAEMKPDDNPQDTNPQYEWMKVREVIDE